VGAASSAPAGDRPQRNELKVVNNSAIGAPLNFQCPCCQACHWIVDCPYVNADPVQFRRVDVAAGCYACGVAGHGHEACTRVPPKCAECGAWHKSPSCPFTAPPQWREFFDAGAQCPYYENAVDGYVTWAAPAADDALAWLCDACGRVSGKAADACTGCGAARQTAGRCPTPLARKKARTEAAADDAASGTASGSGSDSGSDSGSSGDDSSSDDEADVEQAVAVAA
jgi:hypothetical protein